MEEINRKRVLLQPFTESPLSSKRRRMATVADAIVLLNELGIQCHREGKLTEAHTLFRESLVFANQGNTIPSKPEQHSQPQNKTSKATAGPMGIKECEYDEGMHIYRTPLSLQNTSCQQKVAATLLYNTGLTLIRMKDFEGARLSFLKALEATLPECKLPTSTEGLCRLKIHHNLGYCCYRIGRQQEAMSFYLQSMFQVKGGKYDMAVSCNSIAMLHLREANCNSGDCLELLRTSYNNFCSTAGSDSSEAATVLFNLGQARFYRSEYPEALQTFEDALKIRKEHPLGDNSINVAICIFGIGQTYHKMGRLEEAMQCFVKFLEIRELHGAMDYQDVITALNSIANLHKDRGENDKAYSVFEKALVVGVAAFGGPHPHLASTLVSFGSLCFQMGKFETALKLYEESLRAQKEGLGEKHPEIINTLLNIAQIHWHMGRFRSAWTTFKDILTLQVQSIGATSLPVASTVSSMALIYCQMEKYDDALELYQEALRIRRDCLDDPEHADITATLNTIGLVLCKLHEFQLAKDTFEECLRSRIKTLGVDHLDVSMLMHNLAAVHLDLHEEEQAIKLLDRALQIRKKKLGPNHPEVASTLHHLGQAYQIRGTLEEACRCFQQGLEIERKKGDSADKIVVRKLLNLIGNIHLMRAQVPEMMECFEEASRIEEEQNIDFRTSLLVTGHNFFDLSRLHPQCAPVA